MPLEQQRLIGAAGREQRAIPPHRVVEVTSEELLVDRVHEVVGRGELVAVRADTELAGPHPGRAVADLDRRAGYADVGQLDIGDAPAAASRWVAAAATTAHRSESISTSHSPREYGRSGGRPGIAGAGQRHEQAIGDHRPGARQVTVDADCAASTRAVRPSSPARRETTDRRWRGRPRRARAPRRRPSVSRADSWVMPTPRAAF